MSNQPPDRAAANLAALRSDCHRLVEKISTHRLNAKLLTTAKRLLEGLLQYKEGRSPFSSRRKPVKP